MAALPAQRADNIKRDIVAIVNGHNSLKSYVSKLTLVDIFTLEHVVAARVLGSKTNAAFLELHRVAEQFV
jgi:hypothetical protein